MVYIESERVLISFDWPDDCTISNPLLAGLDVRKPGFTSGSNSSKASMAEARGQIQQPRVFRWCLVRSWVIRAFPIQGARPDNPPDRP